MNTTGHAAPHSGFIPSAIGRFAQRCKYRRVGDAYLRGRAIGLKLQLGRVQAGA